MKLSLPAMPSGTNAGPAVGVDEAATGLTALFAGGEDGTVRPMEEALAFASLLLQAGTGSPGKPLPVAGETGGKVLPPLAGSEDGLALAVAGTTPDPSALLEGGPMPAGAPAVEGDLAPASELSPATDARPLHGESADRDALAALVSLLQPGSQPPSTESVAQTTAWPGQRSAASPPIPRPLGMSGTALGASYGGAGDAIADAQLAKSTDMAVSDGAEAKPPQRPTADALALLRSAGPGVEQTAGNGAETARPIGDIRGLSAALLGAQPAPQAPAGPGSAAADRALVTVRAPLGGEQWAESFAERVGWVVNKRLGNAEVRLNPAHLGPVEVSIRVDEEQARVTFSAAHAATREAIEQAVPRLREMLAQQGLELRQTDVGDFASGNHRDPRPGDTADGAGGHGDNAAGRDAGLAAPDAAEDAGDAGRGDGIAVQGLIDTFV